MTKEDIRWGVSLYAGVLRLEYISRNDQIRYFVDPKIVSSVILYYIQCSHSFIEQVLMPTLYKHGWHHCRNGNRSNSDKQRRCLCSNLLQKWYHVSGFALLCQSIWHRPFKEGRSHSVSAACFHILGKNTMVVYGTCGMGNLVDREQKNSL